MSHSFEADGVDRAGVLTLVAATDADFTWMLGGNGLSERGFALPPGGVDEPIHLEWLRGVARRLRAHGHALWMIVADGEAVGLCSFKDTPTAGGEVEIGYAIAASRRRRGHATRAVAALLETAKRDPSVHAVLADTLVDNIASQRVLTKNGFERIGTRVDPIDGELVTWRFCITRDTR